MFAKLDIKDGFWRIFVNKDNIWNFCYSISTKPIPKTIDKTIILVPKSLQMGWSKLLLFFCTATEMAQDVIQAFLPHLTFMPQHKLEEHMVNSTHTSLSSISTKPSTIIEVYVDDFIGATNHLHVEHITQLSRAMLHGIYCIFLSPSVSRHSGEDPIALKKLLVQEGLWCYKKEIRLAFQ